MTTTLIADLEKAERGSQTLDVHVCEALGVEVSLKPVAYEIEATSYSERSDLGIAFVYSPSPTQSIDDALSLLPEGWAWHELRFPASCTGKVFTAVAYPLPESPLISIATGVSKAPCIAICVALLKAKEASDG